MFIFLANPGEEMNLTKVLCKSPKVRFFGADMGHMFIPAQMTTAES